MTVSLKHTFQSAKTDSADPTIVQPSNWNQEHDLTLATNKLLGRATAGTGAAEEISLGTAVSISGGTLAVTNVPVANGGTGAATLTGYVKGNGTSAFTAAASVPVGDITGTLPVTKGGTGAATLTANNVLLGNGTSAVQTIAPGASGNVLRSDGTTWASAAPTVSGSLDAVATGSLSNGSTVVINTDGTVSVVGPSIVATPSAGTSVVLNSNGTNNISTAYDSVNQKVVVVYVDNLNGFGVAKVGTVSGTSISFGSSVTFNAGATGVTACAYDTNAQKIVIAYKDDNNGGFGTAIVGTVSGTSISFGSAAVFLASFGIGGVSLVYDATALKVVISFIDAGANQGKAVVGTVSGTSISFGTVVQFVASAAGVVTAYDANAQKVVVTYRDGSGFGNAIVGTVSGTNISFGTNVVYISAAIGNNAAVYDANALKVVVAYTNAGFGTAIVGTVSGTNISFGTPVVFRSASTSSISAAYDAGVQRDTFAYINGTTGFGDVIAGTVSGTSISFGSSSTYESLALQNPSASVYNAAAQKIVTSYRVLSGGVGRSVVISPTTTVFNLTSKNFIGFSSAAYTNGQTATIQLVGSVNTAQSGLTPGQSYFVLTDGTLSLTAGSPSVFAGTAVAATKIIVKG